jgi:hypothetical protein
MSDSESSSSENDWVAQRCWIDYRKKQDEWERIEYSLYNREQYEQHLLTKPKQPEPETTLRRVMIKRTMAYIDEYFNHTCNIEGPRFSGAREDEGFCDWPKHCTRDMLEDQGHQYLILLIQSKDKTDKFGQDFIVSIELPQDVTPFSWDMMKKEIDDRICWMK